MQHSKVLARHGDLFTLDEPLRLSIGARVDFRTADAAGRVIDGGAGHVTIMNYDTKQVRIHGVPEAVGGGMEIARRGNFGSEDRYGVIADDDGNEVVIRADATHGRLQLQTSLVGVDPKCGRQVAMLLEQMVIYLEIRDDLAFGS